MPTRSAPAPTADVRAPGLFRCVVRHDRFEKVRHGFRYHVALWLVDLDQLPKPQWPQSWFLGFRAADHLGDPSLSIKSNVERFLAVNGIDLGGGRILMLAQARALGYVFDPASFFWCHDQQGRLAALVVEVRNTFGERHCYLVHPNRRGCADVAKQFYVSPFLPVDGRYLMRFALGEQQVRVAVMLRRGTSDGEYAAVLATVYGRRIVTRAGRGWAILAHPFATYRVIALIYWQSLRLRLKGLRPRRRRHHQPQPGVTPSGAPRCRRVAPRVWKMRRASGKGART